MANNKASRAALVDAGVGHLVEDLDQEQTALAVILGDVVQHGPDGGGGCCLALKTSSGELPERFGVHLDQQTWHAPLCGDVWLGTVNGHPPAPADIQRPSAIGGRTPKLEDGQKWAVPTLRRPSGDSDLPSGYRLSGDGSVEKVLSGRWRQLWDESAEVLEHFLALEREEPGPLSGDAAIPRVLQFCVDCLAINYRFSMLEQNVLLPVGSHTWFWLLMVAVDYPAWMKADEEKKTADVEPGTAADAPKSSVGPEA